MYAGFVRKRVAPNDGFIWLHTKPNCLRQQLTGRIELARIDARFEWHPIGAHPQRHHNLFKRCITGAFADTVDCAFNLARSRIDGHESISHREPEIVMTVHANGDVIAIPDYTVIHRANKLGKFVGESVSDRIRNVENRSPFANGHIKDFAEIVNITARRIFG